MSRLLIVIDIIYYYKLYNKYHFILKLIRYVEIDDCLIEIIITI